MVSVPYFFGHLLSIDRLVDFVALPSLCKVLKAESLIVVNITNTQKSGSGLGTLESAVSCCQCQKENKFGGTMLI